MGQSVTDTTFAVDVDQQLNDPLADRSQSNTHAHQDLGTDALALVDQAQEQVLRSDVLGAQSQGLAERQLQHLLHSRTEGRGAGGSGWDW